MMNVSDAIRNRIGSIIASDRVVLFMKGTPQAPQCGFSASVIQILDRFLPSYTTVDALGDPEIREGIKAYSSWPTIPQLYVDGEFIGGCDIVQEMFASGELEKTLRGETPASAD
ncbi:MAG: Grx4 family monothiol glutaredoxin [Deltaproteobacteria bacterium]|nr:Grx4 family monothiol glutaredoxin [Deltaproteobacteria bacterium]